MTLSEVPLRRFAQVDGLTGPLFALSLALLVVGLFLPAISVRVLLGWTEYSILRGVWSFFTAGNYGLFVLVGAFSVVFPLAKTLIGLYVWYAVRPASRRAARLVGVLASLSKWSMLDVFIIAVTVMVIDGSVLTAAEIHAGIFVFAAAVLLSTWAMRRLSATAARAAA